MAKKKAGKKPVKKSPKKSAKKSAPKKAAKKVLKRKPAAKKAKASRKPPKKIAKKPAKKVAAKAKKPVAKAAPKKAPVRVERIQPREVRGERDPESGRERAFVETAINVTDDLAEELGESFVQSATSGEGAGLDLQNEETEEEKGGPFVETTADQEFADDVDESNPEDAERAALPTTAASEDDEE